ncbi:MAG: retroviral-like aspartic protease family protein [Anaerolineae bacterium]
MMPGISYLDTHYPEIPVLEIYLGYPAEKLSLGPLVAIVDTGADGTLIPQKLLDQIETPMVDTVRIRSHWGEWRRVMVFTVDMGFENLRLPAVDVIGDETGTDIILGRNVLNRLKLLLDGPGHYTQIL